MFWELADDDLLLKGLTESECTGIGTFSAFIGHVRSRE